MLAPLACGDEPNQAPIAALSAELNTVTVGEAVVVDGSSSTDPDGDPILFRWSLETPEGSSIELGSPRTRSITFNPDVAGTYTVGLTVDDGEFETDEQTIDIEASAELIPQADAGPDQSVDVGDEVTLDGTGSTVPEGEAPFYRWSFQQKPQASQAELSDSEDAQPTFVADVAGDYIVELEVTTGDHDSEPDTVVISAGEGANQPPTADAGADQNAQAGVEVSLDGTASSDPDSAQLTYAWSVASFPGQAEPTLVDADRATASFVPMLAGEYTVELEVRDDADNVDTDSMVVTVDCAGSLLISEYIEGSSFNKGVEVYNCTADTIELSGFGMCLVSNDDTECSTTYNLKMDGDLDAGGVYTLCHSSIDEAAFDPAGCDVLDNAVNFNGDDRVVIYADSDASGEFSDGDEILDVLGQIDSRPSQAAWADKTLRRCNLEPHDGQTGFDFTEFFTQAVVDDFSDFGVAPSEGC